MHISVSTSSILLLLAAVATATPASTQLGRPPGSHNCEGSGACFFLPDAACITAYSAFITNNISSYMTYTSCTAGTSKGCAAMYKCADDEAYKNPTIDMSAPNATGNDTGISGQQLFMLFQTIESLDGCGPCGSQQLPNPKCWVHLNYCAGCKPSCPGGIAGSPTNSTADSVSSSSSSSSIPAATHLSMASINTVASGTTGNIHAVPSPNVGTS